MEKSLVHSPDPIFSQYNYIENKVFMGLMKSYYDSVMEHKPSKTVRGEMLEVLKFDLRNAARFWLDTQGRSKEWRYGLE